jgi:hypothetical protein
MVRAATSSGLAVSSDPAGLADPFPLIAGCTGADKFEQLSG